MHADFVALVALVTAITAFSAQAAPIALATEAVLDSRKLVGSGEFGHRSLDDFDERGLDLNEVQARQAVDGLSKDHSHPHTRDLDARRITGSHGHDFGPPLGSPNQQRDKTEEVLERGYPPFGRHGALSQYAHQQLPYKRQEGEDVLERGYPPFGRHGALSHYAQQQLPYKRGEAVVQERDYEIPNPTGRWRIPHKRNDEALDERASASPLNPTDPHRRDDATLAERNYLEPLKPFDPPDKRDEDKFEERRLGTHGDNPSGSPPKPKQEALAQRSRENPDEPSGLTSKRDNENLAERNPANPLQPSGPPHKRDSGDLAERGSESANQGSGPPHKRDTGDLAERGSESANQGSGPPHKRDTGNLTERNVLNRDNPLVGHGPPHSRDEESFEDRRRGRHRHSKTWLIKRDEQDIADRGWGQHNPTSFPVKPIPADAAVLGRGESENIVDRGWSGPGDSRRKIPPIRRRESENIVDRGWSGPGDHRRKIPPIGRREDEGLMQRGFAAHPAAFASLPGQLPRLPKREKEDLGARGPVPDTQHFGTLPRRDGEDLGASSPLPRDGLGGGNGGQAGTNGKRDADQELAGRGSSPALVDYKHGQHAAAGPSIQQRADQFRRDPGPAINPYTRGCGSCRHRKRGIGEALAA